VCLNECPRNLVLVNKVDVLEYIEAAERGGSTHCEKKNKQCTQLKGNWGHQALTEYIIKLCQLIWYLAAHEKDPSGQ